MASLALSMECAANKLIIELRVKKAVYCILISIIFSFFACANDDDFSSDGNLSLTFSSATISFDTIFTEMGSATKQFKIYNTNSQSLQIASIKLMNPEKSGFYINIDGQKGPQLKNVEILKKDSLFGFIQVRINPLDSNSPVLIQDSIQFITNGNIQYIYVDAIGQDVHIWRKMAVTKDSVITNTKPLLIFDSLVVKKGATLTIDEGVTIFLKDNAYIDIHGNIEANGSISKPITIRGARFDKIESNIPYDNVPGQWGGIFFYPNSYNNIFKNVHIRNAIGALTFYRSDISKKKATLVNTSVQNTSLYGVRATNCNINATNCLFANSQGASVELRGGEYSFLHCTIANYYSWGNRTKESLVLTSSNDPLGKCDIINSIIYGSVSKELAIGQNVSSMNYQFINCLIKGVETNEAHFSNVIWNKDPLFKNINNNKDYSYNFELTEGSPAINNADKAYSASAPTDIKGKSRLSDTNPDIGCYEWSK